MNSILKTLSNWCIGFAVIYLPVLIYLWFFLRNGILQRYSENFTVMCHVFLYHAAIPLIFIFLAIALRRINDTIFAEKMFLFRQLEDLKKAINTDSSKEK